MRRSVAAVAGALLATGAQVGSALAAETAWQYRLDLRDLPASTRPAEIKVSVDASVAARAGKAPLIAVAVNGIVIARRQASNSGPTVIRAPIEDRLLSTGNSIEVAAIAAVCPTCDAALGSVRPLDVPRFRLEKARQGATDFSQIVTRYRRAVALRVADPRDGKLAELTKAALAPRASVDARAGAAIHVGARPPRGSVPRLRFDLGPVRLMRSDGVEIVSDETLRRSTVVQLLRAGDRPLVWVRPGEAGAVPAELQLDEGDVAIFDAGGRTMEFSTRRDRAVKISYGPGVDPDGSGRTIELWRIGLLAFWLVATVFLAIVYMRLPRPRQSGATA